MSGTLITDRRGQSGSYTILRKLGEGGMAQVYLARQEGMAGVARLAVIKKILPQFSASSSVKEMLLDELRITAQLSHPNIVQIWDWGKDGVDADEFFIALEYVDGADVATLARIERHQQSRIALPLVLRIITETATGLDYAHRRVGLDGRPLNIVHRDVSPHNIICSREGVVKIMDFGIAKGAGKVEVTEVGVVKGKIHYMSPEQYSGADVDRRSDIYSLSVILYQLTTGRLPWVTKAGNVSMRRVHEGSIPRPVDILPDYPRDLDRIVMRGLAHHPAQRYQHASELRDDLYAFAQANDLLAFPRDLADYVNRMVPPAALPAGPEGLSNLPVAETTGPLLSHSDLETQALTPTDEVTPAQRLRDDGQERTVRGGGGGRGGVGGVARAVEEPSVSVAPDLQETLSMRAETGADPAAVTTDLDAVSTATGEDAVTMLRPRPPAGPRIAHEVTEDDVTRQAAFVFPPMARRRGDRRWVVGLVGTMLVLVGALFFVLQWRSRENADARRDGEVATALPTGTLTITSRPAGARVTIDGRKPASCPETPCAVGELALDRTYFVRVEKQGHYVWYDDNLRLAADAPTRHLEPKLDPIAPAKRAGEDGEGAVAKKPADTESKPAPAPAKRPRATEDERPQPSARPRPQPGPRSKAQVAEARISAKEAMLVVDVRPGWAEVWVNGQKIGHTPIQRLIPPGRHKIELKNEELSYHKTIERNFRGGRKVKITETIALPEG